MNRKDFLKGVGLAAGAAVLPTDKAEAVSRSFKLALGGSPTCTLIPSETAGPFPLDLTANTFYFRQDLRENKTGVQLNLRLKIIGQDNCLPMKNVRVNIWACDKDGLYSGYDQANNAGQAGKTYLRGYQMTDADGFVDFTTIFPGWYGGRVCHIHFQVYVSSVYAAVSQLAFPKATKNQIYADNSSLYTKGADPLDVTTDSIFSDGYALQVATLTKNTTTGGYDSYLEVTIKGSGVLATLEPETGGQFKLGQNFPNPYFDETTIPFSLENQSDVRLTLFNLQGQKVHEIIQRGLSAGNQEIAISMKQLGLPVANYAYQLEVVNSNGVFQQAKLMTAVQ